MAGAVVLLILLAWTIYHGLSYERAIRAGRKSIAAAQQFESRFPTARHSITYFTGTHGQPTWQSKAGVGGRYIITMTLPIKVNRFSGTVVAKGEPKFFVVEVEEIQQPPNGAISIAYTDKQLQFGKDVWDKFVASGDLRAIGMEPGVEKPIPGFDENWEKG